MNPTRRLIKKKTHMLALLIAACAVGSSYAGETEAPNLKVLGDFSQPEGSGKWKTVNDNVMGGRSKGGFNFDQGRLIFSGSTNTNGGGFSSIRLAVEKGSLAGAKAVIIRVKGDGRTYKLSLRTNDRRGFMRVAYRSDFETTGEWQEIRIPLDDLEATTFGQAVKGYTFDAKEARMIGFMIYDKKDGPFNLEVEWIKTEN
jgi:NADH dehydrogenase [ubiquinone] 1 alpha subcomplex assembly factor 1